MITLNNITLRFTLAATFLLINCSLLAQSSPNPQSNPAWNNPAIPNTGNPAMVNPSAPAGETLHSHGYTGAQPSGTGITSPGMNSSININSLGTVLSGSTPSTSSGNPSSADQTGGQ